MSVLAAVTAVLAVATAFHLLITYGLVRRLRAHTDLLAVLTAGASRLLPAGTPIPAFTAETTGGDTITQASLWHPAAVALLAVDCPHCRTNLPDFIAYAHGGGYAPAQILAVVTSGEHTDPAARDTMVGALTPHAAVVCEPSQGGTITTALSIQAFPTFYLTSADATLTAGAHAVSQLPGTTTRTPAPAAGGD